MPRDELLQTSQYLETVASKSIQRDSANEIKVDAEITTPAEFSLQLQTITQQSKNPVFTNVTISDANLNCDTQNRLLVLHGDIEFNKVNITTAVTGVSAPKAVFEECKFTEEFKENNFQQGFFSQTVFEKDVKKNDFQNSSFKQAKFNNVDNCNFTNANCTEATFRGDINGLTCFAGANLKNTVFEGKIADTVCFIGSNFDPAMMKTHGGIYIVKELKRVASQMSDDDLKKLETILTKSHEQVKLKVESYGTNKMAYHVNLHHVDALNQAKEAVSEEIGSRNGHSMSVKI